MLQSQVINVLPRRILAGLWASQETRVSQQQQQQHNEPSLPAASAPSFLCSELPVRYTHILRLLSTLSPDALQSPIVRNVAHSYLHDICTLLHPSLQGTSPRALRNILTKLQQRQANSLIRLRYALSNSTMLDNINTIGFGIQLLLDQHLSWSNQDGNEVQAVCPVTIAKQAIDDARHACASALGSQSDIPEIRLQPRIETELTYIPNILHRVLYETSLMALRAKISDQQQPSSSSSSEKSWLQRTWNQLRNNPTNAQQGIELQVFGGPTSVGFRLNSDVPLLPSDLLQDVPRDPIGIPTCARILGQTSDTKLDQHLDSSAVWDAMSGWRSAKVLASHFGGNLDVMSVDGLGASVYLALDRDASLLERYPSRTLATAHKMLLRHHGRAAAAATPALTLQTAQIQLDTFINAISHDPQTPERFYSPHHHSVSLSAAVGHA
ncbi:hypothetical protein BDB00DRAFT_753248 [Zychaea mexicana]|uniref:uncharacterized protein n=1 Tax=Zychaea mexicana TaxID=64656 RepID=UPI0022FE4719|nr:uncharacterized protein BDB00DRAFT_753248 [Zychaea mexicana]KAI9499432.1 hypothetical protein BDB00DRAFT_753248 [Zychaea mexicana]